MAKKAKVLGEVLNDYLRAPKQNYKLHIVYTDGTDDFDRYDEMNECDIVCSTAPEVLSKLLTYAERGGLEYYVITYIPRGTKYKNVSSFIADYLLDGEKVHYWNMFMSRGIDTEGCKAHLYNEKAKEALKGSDRPIELPQDSETLTPVDPDGQYKLFIEPSTPTEVFKDTATMLHFLLQEENATDCDKLLIKAFSNMVDNIIGMREKSQKEDEDYQLYLKLKERFEGGK